MADEHAQPGEEHGKKKHKRHGHRGGHDGPPHEEGVPEWMVSFADNVCLIMGFFVIMLAMNMGPKVGGESSDGKQESGAVPDRLLDLSIAIRDAFNNPVNPHSSVPADLPLVRRLQERTKNSAGRSSDKAPAGNKDSVQSIRASDFYSPAGAVPFADGADDLTPASRRIAIEVADAVRGTNFIVEIRGHVSALEAQGDEQAARLLSYRRALTVARTLAEARIPWARMRLVAMGDTDRITALAYDLKSHRNNQRVEVFVTKEVVAEDPHLKESGETTEEDAGHGAIEESEPVTPDAGPFTAPAAAPAPENKQR